MGDLTQAKSIITQFLAFRGQASRGEIAQYSNYSMPTVLQKVKELTEEGIVEEIGEQQSRGGRKAKLLSLVWNAHYAVGLNITQNHIEMVAIGLNGMILGKRRLRHVFSPEAAYYSKLRQYLQNFISENVDQPDKILGVGISIPGILDTEKEYILVSHAPQLDHYSLKPFCTAIPYPVIFENDANSAAGSEMRFSSSAAVYLSLNNTIGGAFSVNGTLYRGLGNKSCEFGHMILVPGGKRCYCGKEGCIDSYCAASRLSAENLEDFFRQLREGDPTARARWKEYIHYLSIVVSNLRVAFDCEIILGGYVGGYLQDYMAEMEEAVMEQDIFDLDASFLHVGRYKWEASAYGIALQILRNYLAGIDGTQR